MILATTAATIVPPDYGLLSIIIPSIISVTGILLAAWWLRRSNSESNKTEAKKGDTNAFQVVTDQLFKLNEELNDKIAGIEAEVKGLKAKVEAKEAENSVLSQENTELKEQMRSQLSVTRQLANYIKQLITAWPANVGPPPSPNPPIEWKTHL